MVGLLANLVVPPDKPEEVDLKKPKEVVFKPRKVTFKPREVDFKPREVDFKLREVAFKPKEIAFKLREVGIRQACFVVVLSMLTSCYCAA